MKLSTEDFRTAFKVIDAVPISPVLESSQYARIRQDGNTLSMTLTGALWAEATATGVSQGGKATAYVDRRLVKTFLGTASDADTEVLFAKDKLTMKSGQRLELSLHAPVKGYETWKPGSVFDLTDDQIVFLKTAVKYLPVSVGCENMEAVSFGRDSAIVTDSMSIMIVTGSASKVPFLLPIEVARFAASKSDKIAADKTGVGIALSGGFVYQPRSSRLDDYPADALAKWIAESQKAKALTRIKAAELLAVLRVANQFILDKSESVTIEGKDKNLLITVDTVSGKFQRTVPVVGTCALAATRLSAKKTIPWLEYAVSLHDDCELEFARMDKTCVFRFPDDKRTNILIVADL